MNVDLLGFFVSEPIQRIGSGVLAVPGTSEKSQNAWRMAGMGELAGISAIFAGHARRSRGDTASGFGNRRSPYCSYFDAFSPKHTGICAAKRILAKAVFCSNSLFRRVFAILGDSVGTQGASGMAQ
ncbi:hypothetical protein [Labrys neptuniae]|uniref:Uncharacterized protein n=1 Tax=Labrys neptuniae TaxID=376174 RepID=A0ABV3PT91_9HYPH